MRCELTAIGCALAAVASLCWEADAEACGPDFPVQLLAQRDQALLGMTDGVFAIEAAHLVPGPARRFEVVVGEPDGVRARGGERERALYEAGAAAFHAGDLDGAARQFEQLLALPAAERGQRSTWAAFMLGRSRSGAAAIAAYARVRQLTGGGFADELGLAAASLGQEARLHLDAGDRVRAVQLYAEQAAHGHPDAVPSLLFVVRAAIADRADAELARDPVGQRLLAAYLYTRATEILAADRERLWSELLAAPSLAGADRLAAAAYREGAWERAAALARRAPDAALSRWVLAKMALRDGDTATAERLLGQVEAELASCRAEDGATIARARGERATVALLEGREPDAMWHLWAARDRYPEDALFVAERVLTLDELERFAGAVPPVAAAPVDEWAWAPVDRATVRAVLGRRLMRAGRFVEAAYYLPAELWLPALAYADATVRARDATDPIDRARARFGAAAIMRRQGIALFGTAHAPDWAMYDALYDPYWGEGPPAAAGFVGAREWRRVAASAPGSPRRYHYRHVASRIAERAADDLPPRSQAFAAVLCHATRHVFHDDRARVEALWSRYVRQGAAVDFASTLGQICPEPEFERARRLVPRDRRAAWWLAAALAACTVAVAAAALRSRRRRRSIGTTA